MCLFEEIISKVLRILTSSKIQWQPCKILMRLLKHFTLTIKNIFIIFPLTPLRSWPANVHKFLSTSMPPTACSVCVLFFVTRLWAIMYVSFKNNWLVWLGIYFFSLSSPHILCLCCKKNDSGLKSYEKYFICEGSSTCDVWNFQVGC